MPLPSAPLFLQLAVPPELVSPLMIGLMIVIFYFFIIRPQSQRDKQQRSFQDELKKSDRVVTSAGVLGRVSKVDKEAGTVTIEVGKGVYLEVLASHISKALTEAKYVDAAGDK